MATLQAKNALRKKNGNFKRKEPVDKRSQERSPGGEKEGAMEGKRRFRKQMKEARTVQRNWR